jgi:hypothetical protein
MLNNLNEKEIIKDPRRISLLALEGKSVEVLFNDWKTVPCAFVQNWQFKYLITLINQRRIREHNTIGEKHDEAVNNVKLEFRKAFALLWLDIIVFVGKHSKKIRKYTHDQGYYYWGLMQFVDDNFGVMEKDSVLTEKTLRNFLKRQ